VLETAQVELRSGQAPARGPHAGQHPLRPREARVVDEQLRQRALQDVHTALQVAKVRHDVAVHLLNGALPPGAYTRPLFSST
jgi:hypothetical protein